jgi:hypothetical protein
MERINIGESAAAAQPSRVRSRIGRTARFLSATLLCVAALSAPDLAYARGGGGGGGGGGFHGGGGFGGFHAGGLGGFHAGGLGGFHAGGVGGFHGGAPGGFHAGAPGGFHAGNVGGFHGRAPGGFHPGGFSGSGFHVISPGAGMDRSHAGEFRGGSRSDSIVMRGGERAGHWSHGWHNGRYGWWRGYDPYLWSSDGVYDDYSGDGQADASQSWYYCSDPAGYYPYIAQCNTSWQTVPAQ